MTKNEAVESVLDWCRNEIGYHESGSNWTRYAADLEKYPDLFWGGSKQQLAWCATFLVDAFVNVFGYERAVKMLCIPSVPCGAAGCMYAAQYYQDANRWYSSPEPGDQIFFSYAAGEYSHTGIVESVDGSYVNTIEGNTSDMVARRKYPLGSGSIVGYGRPRWELADGEYTPPAPTPTPTPSPSGSGSYGDGILRRGSKGIDVRKMQEKLIKLGFDLGSYGADGDFGSATLSAVKAFQKKYGLEADGEAGPLTLKALNEAIEKLSQGTIMTADGEKQFFPIGDIVYSRASVYYSKPDGGSQSYCHSGKALVIGLKKSARYPYQLCKINGGGSNVYGWVAFDTVEKA